MSTAKELAARLAAVRKILRAGTAVTVEEAAEDCVRARDYFERERNRLDPIVSTAAARAGLSFGGDAGEMLDVVERAIKGAAGPIPMLLWCPACGARHVDKGPFATKPHHTHSCQTCGLTWRPAVIHTVGVQFLPGFKDEPEVRR